MLTQVVWGGLSMSSTKSVFCGINIMDGLQQELEVTRGCKTDNWLYGEYILCI